MISCELVSPSSLLAGRTSDTRVRRCPCMPGSTEIRVPPALTNIYFTIVYETAFFRMFEICTINNHAYLFVFFCPKLMHFSRRGVSWIISDA